MLRTKIYFSVNISLRGLCVSSCSDFKSHYLQVISISCQKDWCDYDCKSPFSFSSWKSLKSKNFKTAGNSLTVNKERYNSYNTHETSKMTEEHRMEWRKCKASSGVRAKKYLTKHQCGGSASSGEAWGPEFKPHCC
jgi:hypothetical protein